MEGGRECHREKQTDRGCVGGGRSGLQSSSCMNQADREGKRLSQVASLTLSFAICIDLTSQVHVIKSM
jgi:hypothetical protein